MFYWILFYLSCIPDFFTLEFIGDSVWLTLAFISLRYRFDLPLFSDLAMAESDAFPAV